MTDKPKFNYKKVLKQIKIACPDGSKVDYVPGKPNGQEAFSIELPKDWGIDDMESCWFMWELSMKYYPHELNFWGHCTVKHPRAHCYITNITTPEELGNDNQT